ncbi:MAG: hypothetical protein COW84_04625 [Gammaproteobacteria bacterium CG22_combo_CG10-13_8_21_14_all_40_8]|nr:MAG: hypothetical protein COW84_04625 [Gammaproteobacteria bacterium CG22_combo_CG10-13_8_21_14_all_40_8]
MLKKSLDKPSKKILSKVIAVIGCDGSGKSTLTGDLYSKFHARHTTELIYLGQSSGNIGQWIKELPVIGSPLGRFLDKKAKNAHNKKSSSPDNLTVLVIYLLSVWRAHKFRRMLKLARKGTMIITDRYPQAEIPGFYFDGTGLGALTADRWLIKKLIKRELRLYQWMASYVPTLLIRLNIDAETAHARKPDHKLTMLQQKTTVIPRLNFNGAQILELDSTSPYEKVLESASQAVAEALKIVHSV